MANGRTKLRAPVEVLKGTDAAAPRRFKMRAYTGAEFLRSYGRAMADLSGFDVPARLPILLNHDESRVVGYADRHQITDEGLVLEGNLVDTPDGAMVGRLSDQGFPWTASVGVEIAKSEAVKEGERARCNGKDVEGPCTLWRKLSLFETSFVTAGPADKATSAAALVEEYCMTPEEFAAANPAAVAAWKAEGAKQERDALTGRLDALTKAIPGRPEFVLAQFLAGADVTVAKAALADVLVEELKTAKAAPAPVAAAEVNAATAAVLASLKARADHPGIGFDAAARQDLTAAPQDPAGKAKADAAAMNGLVDPAALEAFYRAEARGLVRPEVVTRAAAVMGGALKE